MVRKIKPTYLKILKMALQFTFILMVISMKGNGCKIIEKAKENYF